MEQKYGGNLPPGFRFHPTDEELIMYYLRNQATSKPLPVSIIPEIDIYKFDPWELPEKSEFQENEWYFFSPRDRKYPNGVRPNRATVSGYWKATGTDKAIYSGAKYVGVKKALVFYKGRPPKGIKTDWIMHEYRLNDSRRRVGKQSGSMRLDDWVLCRIYKKRQSSGNTTGKVFQEVKVEEPLVQNGKPGGLIYNHENLEQQMMMKFPRTCSITQLFELECFGPISQLLGDNNSYQHDVDHQKVQTGGIPYQQQQQNTDSDKLQVNQTGILNQHPVAVTGNPVFYHFQ